MQRRKALVSFSSGDLGHYLMSRASPFLCRSCFASLPLCAFAFERSSGVGQTRRGDEDDREQHGQREKHSQICHPDADAKDQPPTPPAWPNEIQQNKCQNHSHQNGTAPSSEEKRRRPDPTRMTQVRWIEPGLMADRFGHRHESIAGEAPGDDGWEEEEQGLCVRQPRSFDDRIRRDRIHTPALDNPRRKSARERKIHWPGAAASAVPIVSKLSWLLAGQCSGKLGALILLVRGQPKQHTEQRHIWQPTCQLRPVSPTRAYP